MADVEIWIDGEIKIVDAESLDLAITPPPTPVPSITPRQLRLWLLSRGMLAQVPTLIDAMLEPDKTVAQIEWEFATVFDHQHPFMQALGAAVGLTEQDIEAGFREAALL